METILLVGVFVVFAAVGYFTAAWVVNKKERDDSNK